MAEGSFTTRTVQLYDHEESRRSKNYLVKNNEAKELSSKMHLGIRAEYLGTARLDNSCGIGGIPPKSNLLKTEVKAPQKRPLLMWVIPPKDYRSALAVRGKEDRESGAGVTVTRLRIGLGGKRSLGNNLFRAPAIGHPLCPARSITQFNEQ